jgi:hypothetical protein
VCAAAGGLRRRRCHHRDAAPLLLLQLLLWWSMPRVRGSLLVRAQPLLLGLRHRLRLLLPLLPLLAAASPPLRL